MREIIDLYKKDVDRTMIRENLKLTPQQRSERFVQAMKLVFEIQRHAAAKRDAQRTPTAVADAETKKGQS